MSDADPTPHDPDATDPGDVDAERRRLLRRVVGIGIALAAILAVLAGLGGATGRAGAAIFLLLSATSCAVGATYGVLTAVRDDLKDVPVSRARVVWVVGLFFAAAGLMAMTAGAGG